MLYVMVIDGWYFSTDIHFRIFPKIAGRVSSRKPQELTHLASAFKTQAESELSENRRSLGAFHGEKKNKSAMNHPQFWGTWLYP